MIGKFFIFLINIYRKYISPLKTTPSCRFVPTCSQYAIEAIEEWGAFIGFFLALWRLLRCNPFCRGGFDPVPRRKRRKHSKPKNNENEENSKGSKD